MIKLTDSLSPSLSPSFSLPLLTQVNGYEEVLVETINLCCHYFENSMYMVPKEKYMLLKVTNAPSTAEKLNSIITILLTWQCLGPVLYHECVCYRD